MVWWLFASNKDKIVYGNFTIPHLRSMRYSIALLFFFFAFSPVQSQIIKKKGDSCSCLTSVPVKFPEVSEEDSIYGKVLASYEVDTSCVYGNVKIELSLSPTHDAAVMKAMNELVMQLNKCITVCSFKRCKKEKWFQPFNFISSD